MSDVPQSSKTNIGTGTQQSPIAQPSMRKRLGGQLVNMMFTGLSQGIGSLPIAKPYFHRIDRLTNIPYLYTGSDAHLLDIYRPLGAGEKLPVIFYVHGGGFRILSKDTHWSIALAFAKRGYLVVNINYRLAPKSPFPAAIEDTCNAYLWTLKHIHRYGGDATNIIVAGESAGANLVTSLTIAACYKRTEPWANAVFQTGSVPVATLPACGMLQVSNPQRFFNEQRLSWLVADRINDVSQAYLNIATIPNDGSYDLADPLLFLEKAIKPRRPLPPFFAVVGEKDPIIDDTRRLQNALDNLQTPCETRYYPGGIHAFHAFIWREQAQRSWNDTFEFLDRYNLLPNQPYG